MAIFHMSMTPIARSSGRSAVAAAAYRAGQRLTNERDGLTHDFRRKQGVEASFLVLPAGAGAWAKSRAALWNAAEAAERRVDARVAREIEVALPCELTPAQRLALTRAFAEDLVRRYGVAVDVALHTPHDAGDDRNHHAHLLLTTRQVEAAGLGEKSELELDNKRLAAAGRPTTQLQLRQLRAGWAELVNQHLGQAGHELRVDHRSHADRGLALLPTQHVGVHATQLARRGQPVERARLAPGQAADNAALVRAHPEEILRLITAEKSVFDRRDVARALARYIDEPQAFQEALAIVMASPALVELKPAGRAHGDLARYSTRPMVELEAAMGRSADLLASSARFGVARRHLDRALAARPFLSAEQRAAIEHVTAPQQLAAVVGLAGAGKSTMLAAAREAWEAAGYRVQGAALAGKAAEGLEEAAGIRARTLASWLQAWERGFDTLTGRDVLVIDEAGMIGSTQLARFLLAAQKAGAKVVLVGDPEQLQPIGPGAAFRAIVERVGAAELVGVRRQREEWQRAASVAFGRHRTAEALQAYADAGALAFAESTAVAADQLVDEVLADMSARPAGSRLVLAHRKADVAALNNQIRARLQAAGQLAREIQVATHDGTRGFAAGDRLLFRQNSRELGVKNGGLGTLVRATSTTLTVRLDSDEGPGRGRVVVVPLAAYNHVDHGYATTVHKAQGATVDRAYVLASETMDRHLAYVAMTRHRESVRLYAGRDQFDGLAELSSRLSRAGTKETTLDYAARRGIEADSPLSQPAPRPRPLRPTPAEPTYHTPTPFDDGPP
jgi:Ti-type conjugative transfer relaxase TraA